MTARNIVMVEQLESRALLSATPTVAADLQAVKAAKENLATQRATEIATVKADVAAIPAAIVNISVSIHREESVLHDQINDELNKIVFDEHLGPQTLAIDAAAIHKETVRLRLDEAANNTAAANADALTLAADENQLTADQASTAQHLATDKATLASTKASEGQKIRSTAAAAVNAVAIAKTTLISDQRQSLIVLDEAQQQVTAAMLKLQADARSGV